MTKQEYNKLGAVLRERPYLVLWSSP